jgi:hypothetical protein
MLLLMPSRPLSLAIILAALVTGCCHPHDQAPSSTSSALPHSRLLTRTELFFGLSRPDGGIVTDTQWREFLASTVTPLFPDGLTVIDAYGQWQEAKGRIAQEPSRILIILHEPTDEASSKIEQVREAFKKQFAQEAVMRTDTRACVSF